MDTTRASWRLQYHDHDMAASLTATGAGTLASSSVKLIHHRFTAYGKGLGMLPLVCYTAAAGRMVCKMCGIIVRHKTEPSTMLLLLEGQRPPRFYVLVLSVPSNRGTN